MLRNGIIVWRKSRNPSRTPTNKPAGAKSDWNFETNFATILAKRVGSYNGSGSAQLKDTFVQLQVNPL